MCTRVTVYSDTCILPYNYLGQSEFRTLQLSSYRQCTHVLAKFIYFEKKKKKLLCKVIFSNVRARARVCECVCMCVSARARVSVCVQ